MVTQHLLKDTIERLTKPRLTLQQQAEILVRAIQAEIKRKPKWSVQEVRKAYATLTGQGIGNVKPIIEENLTGYAGEVVIAEGITLFFKDPAIQRRYGYDWVTDSMELLIPGDIRWKVDFPEERKRWIKQAELAFKRVLTGTYKGRSVTDFFLQEGVPIESKAKLQTRVFITKSGKRIPKPATHPDVGNVTNEYGSHLAGTTGFIVGWTLVSVVYKEVQKHSREYQHLKKRVGDSLLEMSRYTKTPFIKRSDIEDEVNQAFKAIAISVEGFMPMTVDKSKVKERLGEGIKFAEQGIDDDAVPKVVRRNLEHIQSVIARTQAL